MNSQRKPTAHDFIERWPLYSKFELLGFEPPKSITRRCSSAVCRRETTWKLLGKWGIPENAGISGSFCSYECVLCAASRYLVVYRWGDYDFDQKGWVVFHKVGQYPAPSIDVSSGLEKRLGGTVDHYRKALMCRSQGYGIGELAYMRRVVEEKTNELIDVVADLAGSSGIPDEQVLLIRKVKEEKRTYDERLNIASEAIPDSLRPGGVNPLGVLHSLLSKGLHGENDEECLQIAESMRDVFEFVFEKLSADVEDRARFAAKVTKLAGAQGDGKIEKK